MATKTSLFGGKPKPLGNKKMTRAQVKKIKGVQPFAPKRK